jgi:hypothetical protein
VWKGITAFPFRTLGWPGPRACGVRVPTALLVAIVTDVEGADDVEEAVAHEGVTKKRHNPSAST